MSKKPEPQTMEDILKTYLDNIQRGGRDGTSEMEVRFGTARGMKPITRIESDNIVQRLLSAGFVKSESQYLLRAKSEFIDPKTGQTKVSNVRAEISGIGNIMNYCKTNDIEVVSDVQFVQKTRARINSQRGVEQLSTQVDPVDVPDFNFRCSLNLEKNLTRTQLTKSIISSWKDNKKEFRYINRHTLTHPDFPIQIDISTVKQSERGKRTYTFDEANLDRISERHEVEIEVDNFKVGIATEYATPQALNVKLKRAILLVLSGLQGTNYPVSYPKQDNLLEQYMKILMGSDYQVKRRVYPRSFVGPSSVSLQVNNIAELNEDANIPNIRNDYTVTDKADGDRKLLVVDSSGSIYLIDTNMNVQFTGARTVNSELFGSIIDGEHILHDKEGRFINLYAAFDIYYRAGEDLRTRGFMCKGDDNPNEYRLPLLVQALAVLRPSGVSSADSPSPMRFEAKTFYASSDNQSIFQACGYLMEKVKSGVFEYQTDGMIFTPMLMGVGSNKIGSTTSPKKMTWDYSFKWKPPKFNTIDFMVTYQRGTDGREDIKNVFQAGTDLSAATQITQYKTAVLRVGFNEEQHGYTNPCQNVIDDDLPTVTDRDDENGYKPMQFFPTNPVDDRAGICNLLLETSGGGDKEVFTEEREVIEDNSIVEFRYNSDKELGWRWEALRVRYDKTADLRSGGRNYGNAYHVANSNWHSIHNPVTEDMITTGSGIPDELADDDVYYNRVSKATITRSLRDFHNLYVKKKLIVGASERGNTLIDYAVGQGGDFSKWISAKLKFVFGIDISRDNIENRMKGACARYLNYKKQFKRMPSALFVAGNSSANIRDTNAIFSDKGKQITNAVFGQGAKDAVELGAGVYKHYGIGERGFDVSSIQFAVHYMFENLTTLNSFLRNVSETTKVGGYFIGTTYDGKRVFDMLRSKKQDESIELQENGVKMWEVTKRYDRSTFPPDASGVGYAIDVFQESIGKTFREFLVNFDYMDRLMENYGFARLTSDEAKELGLPSGRGSFRELFGELQNELERRPSAKNEYGTAIKMSINEKTVSFLNNYFVYKKTHDVDASAVENSKTGTTIEEVLMEQEEGEAAAEAAAKVLAAQQKTKAKPKKLKKKLKLVEK
uniref:mRNA cap 0 methyltransferase domain-containing protein n=1 Tax=viral metagenome TaxID=1070528 RepID=A0A6C0LGK9_9ZZZZ